MNPGRFFMPYMAMNPSVMRNGYAVAGQTGIFNRLVRGLKTFNWNKLLMGANKTLNVMNQTIPIIKQAKPVVGNVKNMLHLAKAFRNETSSNMYSKTNANSTLTKKENSYERSSKYRNDNYPTFFV